MVLLLAFAFVAALQISNAQFPPDIPEECKAPPAGVDHPQECCKIPPFFSEDDFEACGFTRLEPDDHIHGPPDCEKQRCLLKRNQLLDADGEISIAKMRKYMTKWAEKHPEFKKATEIAKDTCVGRHLPGPPQLCETNKLILCISSVIFSECPVWHESRPCNILMNHMKLCKPYFQ